MKKHKNDSGAKRRRPASTLSKSGKYFRKNKKAAAKKNASNREWHKNNPSATKSRVERAKKTRDAKKAGKNIKGKDYDHATKSWVSSKENRGRAGEGGRKKGPKTTTVKRKPIKKTKKTTTSNRKAPKTGVYAKAMKRSKTANKKKK